MEVLLTCFAIFTAKVAHVSLATIRIIYLTKANGTTAAVIGFVETIVYVIALSMVLSNLDRWENIVCYGCGFASGIVVGSMIEEKIAIGTVHVQIVAPQNGGHVQEMLREHGFGVTSIPCQGKTGKHLINHVIMKRKRLGELFKLIQDHHPEAFVSVLDARQTMGGYEEGATTRRGTALERDAVVEARGDAK